MDKSGDTHKVRTVSYWTKRRKIRAAVDEFFNSVQSHSDAAVSASQETEQISESMPSVHVDDDTCENNNGIVKFTHLYLHQVMILNVKLMNLCALEHIVTKRSV